MDNVSQFSATETRSRTVSGGGGVQLYVEETGDRDGRPVLFIHGLSQCGLAWRHQMHSELAGQLRLVTVDLRGHGLSDRPPASDGYNDATRWADDLNAVITALDLDRPILCGWSYGGVVIGDYLRRYGETDLGGICLVGAVTRLGEAAMPFLGPEFVATLPGLFAEDTDASSTALQQFLRLTTNSELSPTDFWLTMGYNSMVSPRVRQAMLSRTLDHDDVLARSTLPVLIAHGLDDRIILPAMSEHLGRLIPLATTSFYPAVGHSPFWEDAGRFNTELLALVATS